MIEYVYFSAKGGQGTSTLAAMHVIQATGEGKAVRIDDLTGSGDLVRILGELPNGASTDGEEDIIIVDAGVIRSPKQITERSKARLVVRPCGLALANAVKYVVRAHNAPEVYVLDEPDVALSPLTVAAALETTLFVPFNDEIAVASQGGKLTERGPTMSYLHKIRF
jgi:hypothetical protein